MKDNRIPPHSMEAEESVLGGLFVHPKIIHSVVDMVGPEDFYSPAMGHVFKVMVDLYEKKTPIDLVTVKDALEVSGTLNQVGGPAFLFDLADCVVSSNHTLHHAQIVRDKSQTRQLINAAASIYESGFSSSKFEDFAGEAEGLVFNTTKKIGGQGLIHTKGLAHEYLDKLTELSANPSSVVGISTGLHDLDNILSGLQDSDLLIIGGRPSMGKTAFAMNLALKAASRQKAATAVYSLEMSKEQLMNRLCAVETGIDLKNLNQGQLGADDWGRVYSAMDVISELPLYIDDTPALTLLELNARSRRLAAESETGLGLIVVDYLQLMRASERTDNREQEIASISRGLKALAKELDCPVIALAQLNRKVEERTDKRPMLSDLRESGAIEQDADVIMFIYRDAAYNKAPDNPKANEVEIIVAKQRNGPTGTVHLYFKKECTRFGNLART